MSAVRKRAVVACSTATTSASVGTAASSARVSGISDEVADADLEDVLTYRTQHDHGDPVVVARAAQLLEGGEGLVRLRQRERRELVPDTAGLALRVHLVDGETDLGRRRSGRAGLRQKLGHRCWFGGVWGGEIGLDHRILRIPDGDLVEVGSVARIGRRKRDHPRRHVGHFEQVRRQRWCRGWRPVVARVSERAKGGDARPRPDVGKHVELGGPRRRGHRKRGGGGCRG